MKNVKKIMVALMAGLMLFLTGSMAANAAPCPPNISCREAITRNGNTQNSSTMNPSTNQVIAYATRHGGWGTFTAQIQRQQLFGLNHVNDSQFSFPENAFPGTTVRFLSSRSSSRFRIRAIGFWPFVNPPTGGFIVEGVASIRVW